MQDQTNSQMRIDSKGKYYTRIVSTQPLEVLLRLASGELVRGSIHVRPDRRLSDEMNDEQHPFVSITGAVVSRDEVELYQVSFIAINRREVQWVIPAQAIGESSEDLEDEDPS